MILLQLLTVAFAVACAWLNSVPVNGMIRYGAKKWESSEFHQANAVVKSFWALTLTLLVTGDLLHKALFAIILWLVQWLVFDPVLNIFIHHKWDYLGETSWLDRTVKNGRIKAAEVLAVIIALNFLYKCLE